jgi:hypothetical protein
MKFAFLTSLLILSFAQSQTNCDKSKIQNGNKLIANKAVPGSTPMKYENLPDDVKLSDEVREESKDENGAVSYKIITVEEKLIKIKAKYEGEKLVDAGGREIRFYKPPIRGASQGFEEDQMQQKRDAEEFNALNEKYTLIILYVDPRKVM